MKVLSANLPGTLSELILSKRAWCRHRSISVKENESQAPRVVSSSPPLPDRGAWLHSVPDRPGTQASSSGAVRTHDAPKESVPSSLEG